MNIHQGKIQNYLRMTLEYNEGGTVKLSMIYYINEVISEFDKEEPRGRRIKTSAASEDLCKVDKDYDKLSTDKAKMLHNIVAKILYIANQARPDTCTVVAFLKTRVREPNKYDWLKLVHIMNYIRGERYLPLIISANGSGFQSC